MIVQVKDSALLWMYIWNISQICILRAVCIVIDANYVDVLFILMMFLVDALNMWQIYTTATLSMWLKWITYICRFAADAKSRHSTLYFSADFLLIQAVYVALIVPIIKWWISKYLLIILTF